jgi:hypothetical protein
MSEINWGLAQMPDIGGNIMRAFEAGQAKRKEVDAQNALAAYATDPNENNLNALAPHNPGFVMQQRQVMHKQARETEERQLVGAALNGDPLARQKLAYINSDMYLKLDENHKKVVDQTMGTIAQQAFSILQLPPQQQGPALQQALTGLQAQGIDTSGFKMTGDPTQDLKSALAMTGHLDEWEKFAQPNYTPVGEAGLAGFQFGKPINGSGGGPQNFAPQQAAPNIPPAAVADLKNNPASAHQFDEIFGQGAAARILGGPTQPASGNFRP